MALSADLRTWLLTFLQCTISFCLKIYFHQERKQYNLIRMFYQKYRKEPWACPLGTCWLTWVRLTCSGRSLARSGSDRESHCDPSVFFTTTGPENHPHTNKSSPASQCDPLERTKHGSLGLMTCWHRCLSTCGSSLCLVEMATSKLCVHCLLLFPNTWAHNLGEEGLTLFMVLVHTFPWPRTGQLTGKEWRDCRGRKQGCGREKGERRGERKRDGGENKLLTESMAMLVGFPLSPFFPTYRMVLPHSGYFFLPR